MRAGFLNLIESIAQQHCFWMGDGGQDVESATPSSLASVVNVRSGFLPHQ
jgi:hypothetical protein